MLTAVILVKSTREALTDLGPRLADVPDDELAEVVTRRLTKLEGIERTQTMVAFQQFSAHDLESMFGLGLEDRPT